MFYRTRKSPSTTVRQSKTTRVISSPANLHELQPADVTDPIEADAVALHEPEDTASMTLGSIAQNEITVKTFYSKMRDLSRRHNLPARYTD